MIGSARKRKRLRPAVLSSGFLLIAAAATVAAYVFCVTVPALGGDEALSHDAATAVVDLFGAFVSKALLFLSFVTAAGLIGLGAVKIRMAVKREGDSAESRGGLRLLTICECALFSCICVWAFTQKAYAFGGVIAAIAAAGTTLNLYELNSLRVRGGRKKENAYGKNGKQ